MAAKYKKREWLYEMYIMHHYSAAIIAQNAGCHEATSRNWLRKHQIPVRSPAKAQSLEVEVRKKIKTASNRLSLAIGEFALTFERLCRDLRLGIWSLLDREGLRNAWELTDILVGDLTAKPLQSILRAIIAQTINLTDEDEKILTSLFSRITRVTEERNSILHSAWYIDYKSRKDLLSDVFVRYRPGYSRKGAKPTPTDHALAEVIQWEAECSTLCRLVDHLSDSLRRGKKIENSFEMTSKEEIEIRQNIRTMQKER